MKKFLSFALAAVMIFGLFGGFTVSAEEVPTLDEWIADTYGNESSISPLSAEMPIAGADGFIEPVSDMPEAKYDGPTGGKFIAPIEPIADKTDWIEIKDRAGLEAMNKNRSGKYYLSADIDLAGVDWLPIGSPNYSFTGTFDGQGYVIRNLTIGTTETSTYTLYTGLFGYISGNAMIRNVGLEGTNININSVAGGGICGYVSGFATIINCYNTGDVSLYYNSFSHYVGGICGYGGFATIINCYNTGDVSFSSNSSYSSYTGGICGYGYGTISNCYNTGDVFANAYPYVGGICGYISGTISNCYNTGDVFANSYSSYSSYTGGICGYSSGTISNCYNTGDVSSRFSYTGGICGYSSATISNCYNTGDVSISAYLYSDTSSYVGGICGYGDGYINIDYCYNTGAISADSYFEADSYSSYSTINAYVGGICGYGNTWIWYCYNTGAISADSYFEADSYSSHSTINAYVGGIGGYNTDRIHNCYNTGVISADSYSASNAYVGGICGYVGKFNDYSGGILYCYNTGVISADSSNAYVGGICGYGDNTILHCYNTGDVSASTTSSYVGGICGYFSKSSFYCYWNSDSGQIVNGNPQSPQKGVGDGEDTTTPLTTAQMKQQTLFAGFNFDNVWVIDPSINNGYPILRGFEYEADPQSCPDCGEYPCECPPLEEIIADWLGESGFVENIPSNIITVQDLIDDLKDLGTTVTVLYEDGSPVPDDKPLGTGMTITNFRGDESIIVVLNDLNGDGTPNIEDAQRYLEYLVGNRDLSDAQKLAIDDYINGDSAIRSLRAFLTAVMP